MARVSVLVIVLFFLGAVNICADTEEKNALEEKSAPEEENTICLLNYCTTMQGFSFSDRQRHFPFEQAYDFDAWGYPERLSFRGGTAEFLDLGLVAYDAVAQIPEGDFSDMVKIYQDHVYIVKCANGKYLKLKILEVSQPPPDLEEGEDFFPAIEFRWDYLE